MSSVNEEKFELVIASLQSSFSVLPSGGAAIGDGNMVSSGISQMKEFDVYYNKGANSQGDDEGGPGEGEQQGGQSETDTAEAQVAQAALEESERIADNIEEQAKQYGIQDQVEIDFNGEYAQITMNGALLFESGSSDIREEALPLVEKVSKILEQYKKNIIDIEGHTDNVPIHNSKYENNNVLSMYRALSVADYIRDHTDLDDSLIKSSGRGDYIPVADNGTPEGRARNRRVEIKVYNSYYSDSATEQGGEGNEP